MFFEAVPPEQTAGLVEFLGFEPSGISLAGLVALGVIGLYKGWIVAGKTVDRIVQSKDDVIEQQRLTIVTLEARGDLQDEALQKLLTHESNFQHIIEEFHRSLMRATGTPIPPNYSPGTPAPDRSGGSS